MERELLSRELKSLGIRYFEHPVMTKEFETNQPIVEDSNTLVSEAAIMPFSRADRECLYVGLLNEVESRNAIKKNLAAYKKYGVDKLNIIRALNSYVDVDVLKVIMTNYPPNFIINEEMVLAETIHQFQAKIYTNPKRWNGIIGPSELASMGFVFHKNKKFNGESANDEIKKLFRKKLIADAIEKHKSLLNNPSLKNINSVNWFNYVINPSILGWTGNNGTGFHLFFILEFRKAEKELYTQLQAELISEFKQKIDGKIYSSNFTRIQKSFDFLRGGFVPRILGKVLDIKQEHKDTRYKSTDTPKSFHLSGLAIDINYTTNPYVKDQAGLKRLKEGAPALVVTKKFTGQKYFEELALANSTQSVFELLHEINEKCRMYFKAKNTKKIKWNDQWKPRETYFVFLDHKKELVVVLRDMIGFAWGTLDLGTGNMGNGDMMHFDMRTSLIGQAFFMVTGGADRIEYLKTVHPHLRPIKVRYLTKGIDY